VGFVGEVVFRRTGFPSILILIGFGLLLGPVFNVFDRQTLTPVTPHLITLSLIIILFHGGMEMDLAAVFSQSARAALLAALYFVFVSIGVTVAARYLLGLGWIQSAMFGPIIAGTSSVVIIPLAQRIGLRKETSLTIALESTITDVLNIVAFFALLELYLGVTVGLPDALRDIAARFGVGIVLGFIAGVVWLAVLYRMRREEYAYISTLSVLILTYFGSEFLGGSGVLSALLMGLVLGNHAHVAHFVRMKMEPEEFAESRRFLVRFHSELAFLMRAFFFVFLGLTYDLTLDTLLFSLTFGLLFSGINIGLRYVAVSLSVIRSPMARDKTAMTLLCGQGLTHATLAVIPLQFAIPNADYYPRIIIMMLLITNVVTSVGALAAKRRARAAAPEREVPPPPAPVDTERSDEEDEAVDDGDEADVPSDDGGKG
jgi:cell volume regulation protein A